jgi:hypothetical protein
MNTEGRSRFTYRNSGMDSVFIRTQDSRIGCEAGLIANSIAADRIFSLLRYKYSVYSTGRYVTGNNSPGIERSI